MARGQVSTEVLILIGLMLLILVPLLLYAYSRANVAGEDISVQKAEFAASRLASAASSVGYLGPAAAVIEEVEIPANLRQIRTDGNNIVLEMDSSTGVRQIVKATPFPLSASGLSQVKKAGTYFFKISALDSPPGTVGIELS